MQIRRHRIVTTIAWWLVGGAVAITLTGATIMFMNSQVNGVPSGTPAHVNPTLQSGPSSAAGNPRSSPTGSTERPPASQPVSSPPALVGHDHEFDVRGGTAIVRCTGPMAYIVLWTVDPGYQVSDLRRGPALTVEIEFRRDEHTDEIAVRCVDGRPVNGEGSSSDEHDD